MDVNGENILNEYDCPVLSLTDLIYCIPSQCIKHSISVVHECTTTCTYVTNCISNVIEHETVQTASLIFKHDWKNKLYCHNIYCMSL